MSVSHLTYVCTPVYGTIVNVPYPYIIRPVRGLSCILIYPPRDLVPGSVCDVALSWLSLVPRYRARLTNASKKVPAVLLCLVCLYLCIFLAILMMATNCFVFFSVSFQNILFICASISI